MDKKILTEINRVREIMGMSGSLLLEQGRLILALTKIGTSDATSWFTALKRVLADDKVYKKFKKADGNLRIPVKQILSDGDLMDVVELVLSKQTPLTLKTPGSLGTALREVGIDITDDAALIMGNGWVNNKSLSNILDEIEPKPKPTPKPKPKPKEIDLNLIFTKTGAQMSEEIKPITEVLQTMMVGNRGMVINAKEVRTFLKDINLPKADIDRHINSLFKKGGDISNTEDIRDIFTLALNNTNFRKEIIDEIGKSTTWQNYVGKHGWSVSQVGELLNMKQTDALVVNFHKELGNAQWFSKWAKKSGKEVFLGKTAKMIYKTLFYLGLGGFTFNHLFGKKYIGRGKQQASMSPDMYIDVQTNKELIKDEGGFSDVEAQLEAKIIYNALQGKATKIKGKSIGGISRTEAFLGGVDEETILNVYDGAPTILSCSQIAYWYEEGPYGTSTLKKALEDGMQVQGISQSITSELGDITIKEVYDTVKNKPWGVNVTAAKEGAWAKRVTQVWPRYRSVLTDMSESPATDYFSRLKGPIDKVLLGKLLAKCDPKSGKDMTTCLGNMSPVYFNEVYEEHFGKRVEDLGDAYSETYTQADAVDSTVEFEKSIKEFVDAEGGWGKNFLNFLSGTETADN